MLFFTLQEGCLNGKEDSEKKNLYDINVNGTKNVIQSCISHNVRFIVFASTTEIFGPQKKYPLSEEDTPAFTGAYSRHKFECERLLDKACSQNKIFAISLRLPMIFGEGFYHERSITFIFDWLMPLSDRKAGATNYPLNKILKIRSAVVVCFISIFSLNNSDNLKGRAF
jgi:nucleoside-diphosphate-sugar epimerase